VQRVAGSRLPDVRILLHKLPEREREKETERGQRLSLLPPPPLLHNMLHAYFVTLIRHMLVASVYKTVDYEKHMRVSKPYRIFESRPPLYHVKIKLGYESLLIQCTIREYAPFLGRQLIYTVLNLLYMISFVRALSMDCKLCVVETLKKSINAWPLVQYCRLGEIFFL
jgi:hypothetical protein